MKTEIELNVNFFFSEMEKRKELADRLVFIRQFQKLLSQTSPDKQVNFEKDYQQYKQTVFEEMDKLISEIHSSKSLI